MIQRKSWQSCDATLGRQYRSKRSKRFDNQSRLRRCAASRPGVARLNRVIRTWQMSTSTDDLLVLTCSGRSAFPFTRRLYKVGLLSARGGGHERVTGEHASFNRN